MKKERGNGSNVIVLSPTGEILVVRQGIAYNSQQRKEWKQLWMLPGGEISRGESPRHAAQEEVEEETGLLIDEQRMRLIALFVQRPNGLVTLYEAREFSGEMNSEATPEISEVKFMDLAEILSRVSEFSIAYLRMILRYIRCTENIDPIPYEGRLSEEVEYPKNTLLKYTDLVLKI